MCAKHNEGSEGKEEIWVEEEETRKGTRHEVEVILQAIFISSLCSAKHKYLTHSAKFSSLLLKGLFFCFLKLVNVTMFYVRMVQHILGNKTL